MRKTVLSPEVAHSGMMLEYLDYVLSFFLQVKKETSQLFTSVNFEDGERAEEGTGSDSSSERNSK